MTPKPPLHDEPPAPWPTRLKNNLIGHIRTRPIDAAMNTLTARLGLSPENTITDDEVASYRWIETSSMSRPLYYAPAMDGQPEPGEVITLYADLTGNGPAEHSALVVGHRRAFLLCLVISPDPAHANDDNWLAIGAGDWDHTGNPGWIRLDQVLGLSIRDIRRHGAVFTRQQFHRVASRLRHNYGWS